MISVVQLDIFSTIKISVVHILKPWFERSWSMWDVASALLLSHSPRASAALYLSSEIPEQQSGNAESGVKFSGLPLRLLRWVNARYFRKCLVNEI